MVDARRRCWTAAAAASDPEVPAPLAEPEPAEAGAAPDAAADGRAAAAADDVVADHEASSAPERSRASSLLQQAGRIEFWEIPPPGLNPSPPAVTDTAAPALHTAGAADGGAALQEALAGGAPQSAEAMVLWVEGAPKGVLKHAPAAGKPLRFVLAHIPLSCALAPLAACR